VWRILPAVDNVDSSISSSWFAASIAAVYEVRFTWEMASPMDLGKLRGLIGMAGSCLANQLWKLHEVENL